jgi:hypothetical protein
MFLFEFESLIIPFTSATKYDRGSILRNRMGNKFSKIHEFHLNTSYLF